MDTHHKIDGWDFSQYLLFTPWFETQRHFSPFLPLKKTVAGEDFLDLRRSSSGNCGSNTYSLSFPWWDEKIVTNIMSLCSASSASYTANARKCLAYISIKTEVLKPNTETIYLLAECLWRFTSLFMFVFVSRWNGVSKAFSFQLSWRVSEWKRDRQAGQNVWRNLIRTLTSGCVIAWLLLAS